MTTGRSPAAKRAVDVTGASMAIVALAPVMVAVALGVAVSMGRPLLFIQARAGLHGRPFRLIKFRTMRELRGSEELITDDDARLTRVGKLLRETSLEELPTLWNVIRGEMSLVGPRPLLLSYLGRYTREQARRHLVKPGITGWAQVNGRNNVSWEEKLRMDVWYVDNGSMRLDIQIVLRTIVKLLTRDGVTLEGCSTTKEFMGTPREVGSEGYST